MVPTPVTSEAPSMGGTALNGAQAAGTGLMQRTPRPTTTMTKPMTTGTAPLGGATPAAGTPPLGGGAGMAGSVAGAGTAPMTRGFSSFNPQQQQMLNDAGMGRSDWNSNSYQTDGGPSGQQLLNQMYQIQDPAQQHAFYNKYAGKGAGGNDLSAQLMLDKGGLTQMNQWINDTGYNGGMANTNYTGSQAGYGGAADSYGALPPQPGQQQGPGGQSDMMQPQGGNYDMMQRVGRGGPGGQPGMMQPQGGSPGQPQGGYQPSPGFQGGTPGGGQGDLSSGGINMGQGGPIQSGMQGGGYYQDQARQAYMDQSRRNLDPQWQQNQSNLESKLTNMGLARGSAAWEREAANMSRSQNDAYDMAGRNAILTAGQEGSRMQGMDIGAGNFNNAAQQQGWNQRYGQAQLNQGRYGQDLNYDSQQTGYALQGRQIANAERLQDYNMMNDMRMQPYREQNAAMQGMYPTGSSQYASFTPAQGAGGQNSQGYSGQIIGANNQQYEGYNAIGGALGSMGGSYLQYAPQYGSGSTNPGAYVGSPFGTV